MIQRIQTVFLALAAIINLSVYFTPIYKKSMADPQDWIGIGLTATLLVALVLSLISIFLYNNRSNQIRWVKYAAFVQIMALAFCIGVLFSLGGIGTYLWDEALGAGLTLIGFIFQMLAIRYIKKDEDLVRSMDRIR